MMIWAEWAHRELWAADDAHNVELGPRLKKKKNLRGQLLHHRLPRQPPAILRACRCAMVWYVG